MPETCCWYARSSGCPRRASRLRTSRRRPITRCAWGRCRCRARSSSAGWRGRWGSAEEDPVALVPDGCGHGRLALGDRCVDDRRVIVLARERDGRLAGDELAHEAEVGVADLEAVPAARPADVE